MHLRRTATNTPMYPWVSRRRAGSDAQQAIPLGAAFGAETGTALCFARLFEELAATHLFFDAAALDQFTEAANRFLNAFPLADSELDHTFPET